mgnify:CR=1 FL=1
MNNLNIFKKYNIGFSNPRSKKKKNNSYNHYRRESSITSCDLGRLEYCYDKRNDKGRYKEYKCNIFLHKSKKTLVKFSVSTGRTVEYLQFYLPSINEINNTSILVVSVSSFFYYEGYANEYLITNIECPIINGKYIQGLRFYLR